MKEKLTLLGIIVLGIAVLAVIVVPLHSGAGVDQSVTLSDSPLPTPTSPPFTPTPAPPPPTPEPPLSREAERAVEYISQREGIPRESLLVVNDYERNYPYSERTFRAVSILVTPREERQYFRLLVDLADGSIEEDWDAIQAAEAAAYAEQYGRLHPTLYKRLQEVGDEEPLPKGVVNSSQLCYTGFVSTSGHIQGSVVPPFGLMAVRNNCIASYRLRSAAVQGKG